MIKSPLYYTLGADHIAIPCFDVVTWSNSFKKNNRRVAVDECDAYKVSTVFLGIDHNFYGGDPLIFETLVFLPDDETGEMDRYSTWAEAMAGHERIRSMLAHEHKNASKLSVSLLRELMDKEKTEK